MNNWTTFSIRLTLKLCKISLFFVSYTSWKLLPTRTLMPRCHALSVLSVPGLLGWLLLSSQSICILTILWKSCTHLMTLMPLFSHPLLFLSVSYIKHSQADEHRTHSVNFMMIYFPSGGIIKAEAMHWINSRTFHTPSQLGAAPIRIMSLSRAPKSCCGQMWLYLILTSNVKKEPPNTSVALANLYEIVISVFFKTFMMLFMFLTCVIIWFISKVKCSRNSEVEKPL